MSRINKVFYANGSQWVPGQDLYVGDNGVWKRARAKLVGRNGRWVEVFDNEYPDENDVIRINSLSYRAGTPNQGALSLTGNGLDGLARPNPNDYFYFPLRNNLAENIENSSNLIAINGPLTFNPINGVMLDSSIEQYIRVPTDSEGGVDLRGLLGAGAGNRYWLMGIQFKPTTLPVGENKTFVIDTGIAEKRISLSFNEIGDLIFTWEAGTRTQLKMYSKVVPGEWCGVWIMHDPTAPVKLRMVDHLGSGASTSGFIEYFTPTMTEEQAAIRLGHGYNDGIETIVEEYFNTAVVHPDITITTPTEIQHGLDSYRTAQPGDAMLPGTGKYYIEVENFTTYDMHIGVGEPGAPLNAAPGVNGWAVNTINGRKFNHQTGGGTTWGTATPANAVLGLLYDSDTGQIEYFVNGASRGKPFAAGAITVPVKFLIGGRGSVAGGTVFRAKLHHTTNTWYMIQSGYTQEFPKESTMAPGEVALFSGQLRNFFVRNAPFADETVQRSLIDPEETMEFAWYNRDTFEVFVENRCLLKIQDGELLCTVPDIPPGDYEVYIKRGESASAPKSFSVVPFEYRKTPLLLNFETAKVHEIRAALIRANKAWGGSNGGVVPENIIHDPVNGVVKVRACGDQYTGPITGVDRDGKPVARTTRIGGCVVTRDYFGPGSYKVLAKLPVKDGVVSAFWTFHYEEAFAGHYLHNAHLADGLRVVGNAEDGFYTVRNHEIDIEIPTALKGAPDMEVVDYRNARFNTWRGENRNWDVAEGDPAYWTEYTDDFINHGVEVNDEDFHEFRFDWHLDNDPRVEFYIDGILKHTVRNTVPDIPGRFWIGLWFPSAAGNHWAGRDAAFAEEWMEIKQISITPFAQDGNVRRVGESYPNDHFVDFFDTPV